MNKIFSLKKTKISLKNIIVFVFILADLSAFSQGLDCSTATPYCDAPGGAPVSFSNNTNNSSEAGPNYGCLTTHPNPAWFYFKTTTAGNYIFDLGQGTSCGQTNLDVDFICWGPFTNPITACNNLTAANTVDCSYSASATEVIDVLNAPAGQYYIVLITNYSNSSGCVQFGLQASSPPTDCSITCASVLSGPGIVSYPSTNPQNGVPATPMPATVACNSGIQNMYATNVTPFGNPITPGVMITFPNNANTSNSVTWLENGSVIGCFGPSASCQNLTPSYNMQLQFSYMSPSATNQFSFCETNSTEPNMATNIKDLAGGANMPGTPFTWNDDGACQTINIPAGTILGISTWSSTCGSCLTGVTDWGAAQFNPAAASIGTHTITYSYNSQQPGCNTYTTSITITVTNPYNASFVPPGPFCAGASCATLTPSNTYTSGTGTWSGTGVSGNTFCPSTSGVGSFPITYTIGISPTCKATQTNTVTVNANPTANAGSPVSLNCTSTNTTLSGSGGSTYSWTGPSGGIVSGSNTATPTVSLAGTYTLLVANGTCTNSATVVVSQNASTPTVTSSGGALNCTLTSVNAIATTTATPVSYNWSGTGITSPTNISTITVNQPGTYNYTVTNTSNGCKTTGSVAVTQNTASPVVATSSGTLNCAVTSVNASATTTSSPVSYNWSGSGITAGSGTGTITVNQSGTYNFTVTNTSNGCSTIGSQAITQNTLSPSVVSSASSILNCTLTTVNAIATTTTNPVSYSWSGNGITSATNISTITVNQPGTYNYTVTNSLNGCVTIGSQAITQNTLVPIVTSTSPSVLNCTLTSVNADATTTTTPVSYNWSGNGITSAANISTITVNQPGTFNYTVTNTSNGCSTSGSQAITQNTISPVVTSSTSGVLNCTLTSVNASATTTATPVSYNWSGIGITTSNNISTIAVNQPGTYNYTVTNTSNGCSTTGSQSVTQNTTAPSTSATNATLTCVNTSTILSGGPLSDVTYSWSGNGLSGSTNLASVTATTTGNYTLTTVSTVNGCTNTAVATVTNDLTQPTVNAGSPQTLLCGVSSVTLSGSATPIGSTANWLGGVCGNASSFTTTACAPGTYTLVATHPVSGCTNTSTVVVSSSTNVPQATVNAITNSITCTNSVVAIGVTLSNSDPVSYSWSGPGISGTSNTAVTSATVAGTYSVTITNTISNCQSTFNLTVPTNTTPVVANASTSSSITCSTNTVNITATPTGTNYVYSWSGPGTITNGTTNNPIVDLGGNYVLTVTDNINGCSGNFTVAVPTNTVIPSLILAANSLTTTCTTSTITLGASSDADPNSVYSWTVSNGGSLNNTNTNNPVAGSGGTYDVAVTNTINGCVSAPQTVTVTADANIPTFTLTSSSVSLTCLTTSQTVTVNTTSPDLTYSWTPTPSSGVSSSSPTFNAPGIYSCVITNTMNNCSTGTQVTVTNNTITPTIVPISNLSITCTSTLVTITSISTPSSGVSYVWTGPGIVGSSVGSSIDVNVSGNYDVVIMDAANGCTNTATSIVGNNTTPPTLTLTTTSSVLSCAVTTSTLLASTSATDVPTWSTPSGSSANPVIASFAGNYIATVTDASNGCSASQTLTITGNTVSPTADAGANVSIPCGSLSTQLNGSTTSTDVVTYDWSGPSATSISGPTNIQNPTITQPGVYTLTVTNTSNGCTSTATVNVTQSIVTASISADQTSGLSPLTVNFDGSGSSGATSYSWNFGDGNVAGNVNPSNIFTSNGSYTVTLIATASPCSDTATIVIIVEDALSLEIPNVFTPNNDGSNDVFTIKSTGVKEITLQIFNRWGQKLYEFTGAKASWDGKTPNGATAPEGTYFYFVIATGYDKKEIKQNGVLNLFR